MNITSCDTNIEPLWQTYLKAVMFASPAVIAWGVACVYLVPKLREVCYVARLEPRQLGWLWHAPWALVRDGWSIGIALIFLLAVLELFCRGWERHRRVTVSSVVWVVNGIVLFGLTASLILALIAGASLASPK